MMTTKLKSFLMLLAMVVGGNNAWAQQEVYDFETWQQYPGATANMGGSYDPITGGQYLSSITTTNNGTLTIQNNRIAFNPNYNQYGYNLNSTDYGHGLRSYGNGSNHVAYLAICNCWNGDRVKITYSGGTLKFNENDCAKVNGVFVTAGQTLESDAEFSCAKSSGDILIKSEDLFLIIKKIEVYYHSERASVTFNNPPSTMNVGDEFNTNNTGITIAPWNATPVFSSSNTNAVTVDKYGYVKAVGSGIATISAQLQIGPEQGNNNASSSSAQFTVTVPRYNFDPAIEVYDLSGQNGTTYSTTDAGFQLNLDDHNALYLTHLLSGLSLNNRIAVSETSDSQTWNWEFDGGLKALYSWHNVSICNLIEGDRVKITYEGTALFSSRQGSNIYNGCSAFKDLANNGDFDDAEDVVITGGMTVENNVFYTITESGHLDIGLSENSKITKIEIYGDHQAQMLDRYDAAASGYTAYFSQTGQLLAKEHIVPGGLDVHVGNENTTQHAIVVSSDKGPVSFVYDQDHFKMARHATWGSYDVSSELPATGTFYKFIPEVDGTMTVKMKAYNVRYTDLSDPSSETTSGSGIQCPYYLMKVTGKDANNKPVFGEVESHNHYNGHDVEFKDIDVVANTVYYIYGWWNSNNQDCGVAQLIEVTFVPDNSVTPLAKWVASGTTSDNDLAEVSKYTTVTVMKKSENIAYCNPYIDSYTVTENNITVTKYKLAINNISFVDANKGGGTILIKIGDPNKDANPVFAYTIAYKADYNGGEGHRWDFSTSPLRGLKWSDKSKEAADLVFSTGTDENGLLWEEMHKVNPDDGTPLSEWTKSYRMKKNDVIYDPMYLNKHEMVGDNAGMIWTTEGLIIKTAPNQSCINNEYTDASKHDSIDHITSRKSPDPDRYVGILPGGEFTIPCLKKDDRVTIFMGSGTGSGTEAIFMNVTNALDAIGEEIKQVYHVGGSLWNADPSQGHNDPNYRGAYHFIAKADGDMVFKLADRGTLAKLYSIEIYRGKHRWTDDATRLENRTYNGEAYTAYAYQLLNTYNTTNETVAKAAYTLHYRGKGEGLRTPTVVYKSGNITVDTAKVSANLVYARQGNEHNIFYKSVNEEAGLFRMRIECMDLDGKYVTDYGMQNVSVGYLGKMEYPYTWDFTDLMKYAYTDANTGTKHRIPKAISDAEGYNEKTEFMDYTFDGTKAIDQWKFYQEETGSYAKPAGYGLNIKNSGVGGEIVFPTRTQLFAGDQFLDEAAGLSIIKNAHENYNGHLRVSDQGLALYARSGSELWQVMIPAVPATAAVYIRAKAIGSTRKPRTVTVNGSAITYSKDGKDDDVYVYAVKGTGGDMTFDLGDMIVQKIAVASDAKTVNKYGWNTESRNHPIDPSLLPYMTGKDFRTYVVTAANEENNTVTLQRIDGVQTDESDFSAANIIIPAANDGDKNACIIYNHDGEAVDLFGENSGFHLFVPDMHYNDAEIPSIPDENLLKAQVNPVASPNYVPRTTTISGVDYANYVFSYMYMKVDENGNSTSGAREGEQAFYRIRANGGATSSANKAYLSIPISSSSRAASPTASTSQPANSYSIKFLSAKDVLTMGDVNGDGSFNKMDVNAMADRMAGRPTSNFIKSVADMNDDGNIDIVDLTLMIKKITGE